MSDREHMGTEQFEADRPHPHFRFDEYKTSPWEQKLAGCLLLAAVSLAAGIALEDQAVQGQRQQEAELLASRVRRCETDPNFGTAVIRQSGKIECHALMPRFLLPLEKQPMHKPTRRELRRILKTTMKGSQ